MYTESGKVNEGLLAGKRFATENGARGRKGKRGEEERSRRGRGGKEARVTFGQSQREERQEYGARGGFDTIVSIANSV